MQANGVSEGQITQVRGFAEQRLRKPDAPQDPSNRRILFIVQYREKTAEGPEKEAAEKSRRRDSRKTLRKKLRNPVLTLACLRRKPSPTDESKSRTYIGVTD
jgi:hypothetical protein